MDTARAALVERLATFPERLAAAAADPADPADPSDPSDGEWSTADVVRHLVAVEDEVWHRRLDQLAQPNAVPRWQHMEPRPRVLPDPALAAALGIFADLRAATVARLHALDATGWARSGVHATYGQLDVLGLVRLAVDHDDEHLAGLVARAPASASTTGAAT